MEEEGELVESGNIGIDKELALKKLQRFQLGSEVPRVGLWLRCAVASGATRMTLDGGRTWSEFRFDGKPLLKKDLQAPYEALFRPEKLAALRDKFFSLAYINSLHPNIDGMEIRSGRGKRRRLLSAYELGDEKVTLEDDGGVDTVVRWRWPFWSLAVTSTHPAYQRVNPEMAKKPLEPTPIPVIGHGVFRQWGRIVPLGSDPDEEDPVVRVGGTRILIRSTLNAPLGPSRFSISTYGVKVCPLEGVEAPMFFTGWADDPGLRLNASLTGVVDDERFKLVKRRFKKELDRLLDQDPS